MSEAFRFVTAAYAITWLVLLGYAGYVTRKWRRAERLYEERDRD